MIKECETLILEMCSRAYMTQDKLITSDEIIEEARNKWPNHIRWTQYEDNGEIKFLHDINNAKENLKNKALICNPKIKQYRLLNCYFFYFLVIIYHLLFIK